MRLPPGMGSADFARAIGEFEDAVDPDGILSAGRYGIWPRHLRNTGK